MDGSAAGAAAAGALEDSVVGRIWSVGVLSAGCAVTGGRDESLGGSTTGAIDGGGGGAGFLTVGV